MSFWHSVTKVLFLLSFTLELGTKELPWIENVTEVALFPIVPGSSEVFIHLPIYSGCFEPLKCPVFPFSKCSRCRWMRAEKSFTALTPCSHYAHSSHTMFSRKLDKWSDRNQLLHMASFRCGDVLLTRIQSLKSQMNWKSPAMDTFPDRMFSLLSLWLKHGFSSITVPVEHIRAHMQWRAAAATAAASVWLLFLFHAFIGLGCCLPARADETN